jgi:hypothetical protein
MGQLAEFLHGASNDYHLVSRGQQPEEEKAHAVSRRFAENFQLKSKYAYWNVNSNNVSDKYRNYLAESAKGISNLAFDTEFVSKEILATKFKPIYGPEFKKLLWDAYINDYILGEATNIRSWSAFANQTQISLMPMSNKVYESEEDLTEDLDATGYNEDERNKIVKFIETVTRNIGLEWYQQDLARQAMVGGVGALFLETFIEDTKINDIDIPKGTPALIKPLHWSFLDQVKVDTATWAFESVRYTDFENSYSNDGPVYIPARNLLYVTRNDNHVTPNNLYYGISDYHSILKLSNIIRQAEEIDFPEIVTSFWCQPGILKFKNMNTNEMDRFMASIGPGLIRGFNSQVDFESVNIKHDGWFLITLLQTVISHMLMKMRIPEFMFSFGGKSTSRSDVEIQMNAYDKLVLSSDRWWMGHHLSTQLYDYLLSLATKEPDPTRQKFRVVQNYMPWSFEDILAKANSLELLVRRYFITLQEGRQFLGMKPYNKEISKRVNPIGQLTDIPPIDKIKFEQQQELQKQKMDQQQKTMDQFASKNPLPEGQKGFQPPTERANASTIGTSGAGRGNTK